MKTRNLGDGGRGYPKPKTRQSGLLSGAGQSGFEVGDEVARILDPDREANGRSGDSEQLQALGAEADVRGEFGVRKYGLDAAQAGRQVPELQVADEALVPGDQPGRRRVHTFVPQTLLAHRPGW